MIPTYIYGTVGPWTGCGFDTIQLIFPPPDILGYDACVPPILSNPTEAPPFVGPPVSDGSVQGPAVIV